MPTLTGLTASPSNCSGDVRKNRHFGQALCTLARYEVRQIRAGHEGAWWPGYATVKKRPAANMGFNIDAEERTAETLNGRH